MDPKSATLGPVNLTDGSARPPGPGATTPPRRAEVRAAAGVKYDFIDALRGFAVVGVIINHVQRNIEVLDAMGRKASLSPLLHAIGVQGARGVQLFFIVSALTLCISQAQRQSESRAWFNFFLRRFFRIAPMFYVALLVYTIFPALAGQSIWPSAGHLISTMTFTNGWSPYWINAAHAIVPGGWSIAVEMTFYVLFPLLFQTINSRARAMALFGIAVVGSIGVLYGSSLIDPIGDPTLWSIFCNLWFPNQFPVFCLGFVLYFVLRERQSGAIAASHPTVPTAPSKMRINAALWLAVSLLLPLAFWPQNVVPVHLLYSVDFAIIVVCLAASPVRPIVNRLSCYVGRISFSAYLVHFYVLGKAAYLLQGLRLNHWLSPEGFFFALAFLGFAGTLVAASVTYRLIEVPGQQLGRYLIGRVKRTAKEFKPVQSTI